MTNNATLQMFNRYLSLLETKGNDCCSIDKTDNEHLKWLCREAIININTYSIDKLSRWLGFVQGVIIMKGYCTVDEERNFSRPLFTKYK